MSGRLSDFVKSQRTFDAELTQTSDSWQKAILPTLHDLLLCEDIVGVLMKI